MQAMQLKRQRRVWGFPSKDSDYDVRFVYIRPIEWLGSPILYLERFSFLDQLRTIRANYFSPKATIYHYLNMASGNYRDYLLGNKAKIKKYFYVLRPILACKWLENNKTIPPIEFEKLLETQVEDPTLYNEIEVLLDRKKSGMSLT